MKNKISTRMVTNLIRLRSIAFALSFTETSPKPNAISIWPRRARMIADYSRKFACNSRLSALKVYFLLFSLLMPITLTGCATEYNLATQREETLLYGTEKEVSIGEAVSSKIEAEYEIITDVDVNERIERILDKIVEVCDRKDLVYFIKVLDKDLMNAISLPGGYIYVFKGLIDNVENDDQLAGVIAHEVGHITARHGIKRLQASYGFTLLQVLASQTNSRVGGGVNIALTSLFLEHSQQDEYEADRLSVKYMNKAGYDAGEMVFFLQKLKEEQEKAPLKKFSYWRTHPNISRRIATVNKEIKGKLEFKDYLNLMESK